MGPEPEPRSCVLLESFCVGKTHAHACQRLAVMWRVERCQIWSRRHHVGRGHRADARSAWNTPSSLSPSVSEQRTCQLRQTSCGAKRSIVGCRMLTLMIQTRVMEFADLEVPVSQIYASPVHSGLTTPMLAFELCLYSGRPPEPHSCWFSSPASPHAEFLGLADPIR